MKSSQIISHYIKTPNHMISSEIKSFQKKFEKTQ